MKRHNVKGHIATGHSVTRGALCEEAQCGAVGPSVGWPAVESVSTRPRQADAQTMAWYPTPRVNGGRRTSADHLLGVVRTGGRSGCSACGNGRVIHVENQAVPA